MRLLLVVLALSFGCNFGNDSTQPAFKRNEVWSVQLSVNGKADLYKMVGNNLRHKFQDYYLAEEKTRNWLDKLAKIETLRTDHPGTPISQSTTDAIEIILENKSRFLYQGGHTDEAYYALVQKIPPDPKAFTGIIYLTKEDYASVFQESKNLRTESLPLQSVDRIQYVVNDRTLTLDEGQVKNVKDVLATAQIVGYPHSGPVTKEIEEAFHLKERINGNLPGTLILLSKSGPVTMTFGKPEPHSPKTYIHIKDRNEIHEANIGNWAKLEMLLGSMANKNSI